MTKPKKRPEPRPLIVPTIAALHTAYHTLVAEQHRILATSDPEYCPKAERLRQVAQMLADQIELRTGKEP